MTKKIDAKLEERRAQVDREIVQAIEYALEEAVSSSGGVFTGFSMKIGDLDVLLTLRAIVDGEKSVCFVGCPDMSSCFRKAVVEGFNGGLRWRADKFANGQS